MNTTELKQLGYGIECQVYEVNAKIVCKNFNDIESQEPQPKRAEFAYRMQRIAYRYGLAPRPLAIEFNQYYSEYVESFESTANYLGSWRDMKNTEEFQEFEEQLEKVFGVFRDSHSGNIARLPNGDLCCIDFGVFGFMRSRIGSLLMDKLGIEL